MRAEVASGLLRVENVKAFNAHGIGQTAYYQRHQGVTLADVLTVAESEAEVWEIADGWATAQGVNQYTTEMIRECEAVERSAWERDEELGDY